MSTEDPQATAAAAGGASPDHPQAEQPKAKQAKPKKEQKPKGKDGKGKDEKGKGKAASASAGVSIASHPRARAQVRRAKGWGGLAGFGIGAYVSSHAGIPMDQVALRSVAVGIAAYMVAWACAVTVWRHLVLAELRALSERHDAGRAGAGADDGPIAEPGT